jgi:hypothetical protein
MDAHFQQYCVGIALSLNSKAVLLERGLSDPTPAPCRTVQPACGLSKCSRMSQVILPSLLCSPVLYCHCTDDVTQHCSPVLYCHCTRHGFCHAPLNGLHPRSVLSLYTPGMCLWMGVCSHGSIRMPTSCFLQQQSMACWLQQCTGSWTSLQADPVPFSPSWLCSRRSLSFGWYV